MAYQVPLKKLIGKELEQVTHSKEKHLNEGFSEASGEQTL